MEEERQEPKRQRKYKKKLLKNLQDQLEFYFGDSNLHKDRFLLKKIEENPEGYVPVEVIANFNKMKSFTEDRALIIKAMKNSSLLEVSSDEQFVRRATPLSEPSNVDERTLYVENLSLDTTHETLRTIFKKYGDVTYVSIPRFKNRQVKGFAFIEFSSTEEANNALKDFTEPHQQGNTVDEESVPEEGSRKRKHFDTEIKSTKKPKLEEASEDVDNDNNTKEKETTPLNVISKIEWMKLKRIYKELQKKQMSQLKETMKEQSSGASEEVSKTTEQETTVEDLSTSKKSPPDAENCDVNAVTVEIAMSTLPADEVERICRQCGDVTVFQFDHESHMGQVVFTDLASAQRLTASVKDNEICCSIKSNLSKRKQKKRKRRGREKISTKVLKREAAERIHIIFDSNDEDST